MSRHPRRIPQEIRAIQKELQLLADNPQMRRRRGHLISYEAPYSDSRRSTDTENRSRRSVTDCGTYAADQSRNYAAGLL